MLLGYPEQGYRNSCWWLKRDVAAVFLRLWNCFFFFSFLSLFFLLPVILYLSLSALTRLLSSSFYDHSRVLPRLTISPRVDCYRSQASYKETQGDSNFLKTSRRVIPANWPPTNHSSAAIKMSPKRLLIWTGPHIHFITYVSGRIVWDDHFCRVLKKIFFSFALQPAIIQSGISCWKKIRQAYQKVRPPSTFRCRLSFTLLRSCDADTPRNLVRKARCLGFSLCFCTGFHRQIDRLFFKLTYGIH